MNQESAKEQIVAFRALLDDAERRLAVIEHDYLRLNEVAQIEKTLASSYRCQNRIREIGAALEPAGMQSNGFIRAGRRADGGYVVVDDFQNLAALISLGVGDDVSFDLAFAERGIPVFQYDHTIERPPAKHELFEFHQIKVACYRNESSVTLKELATHHAINLKTILKIDIEGDEWEIFDETPVETLECFSQIICEFHWFHRCYEDEWNERALRVLRKLRSRFAVVHIHANNFSPIRSLGNVPFPDVLEVTYANLSLYPTQPSTVRFPTDLDAPNDPSTPDIILGEFRFAGTK
jgi:hypothetical protein